jgi:hypothetical protein
MAQNPFNAGSFVVTTNVWDVARVYEIEVGSPEFKELLVRLYQNVNNIATLLNIKDTGVYNTFEIINGQRYFPDPALNSGTAGVAVARQVYRTTVNFGALPNAGTKSVAHKITTTPKTTFTRIYATASDTTGREYIPIPYASATATDIIELSVDGTNVNITTGSDRTSFTVCYVVLEYLQS